MDIIYGYSIYRFVLFHIPFTFYTKTLDISKYILVKSTIKAHGSINGTPKINSINLRAGKRGRNRSGSWSQGNCLPNYT